MSEVPGYSGRKSLAVALMVGSMGVLSICLGAVGLVLQFNAADGGAVQLLAISAAVVVSGLCWVAAAYLKSRESEFDQSPWFVALLLFGAALASPTALLLRDL